MPSTSSRWRLLAAISITPTITAISKPPRAASTSTGSLTPRWRCRVFFTMSAAGDGVSPSYAGVLSMSSRTGVSLKRDKTMAALSLEPTPRPASTTALPRSLSPISMPARMAACACSTLIAADNLALRVPCAILRIKRWSCAGRSWATPQSTTLSSICCARANTDSGNRPPMSWFTMSCVLGWCGPPMPSTAMPWSAAKISICGSKKRGLSEFCISPKRTASGSSSPRLPPPWLRRWIFSSSAISSAGLEVGDTSDREAMASSVVGPFSARTGGRPGWPSRR